MISFTNPDLLTVANKNTLRGYTTVYSAAGAIARGLLSLSDEFFPVDFVLPDGTIVTRSEEETEDFSSIVVYPNPNNGIIKINIPEDQYEKDSNVQLYDIIGNRILTKKLNSGVNEINVTNSISSGIIIYTITNTDGNVIKTGKLVITK